MKTLYTVFNKFTNEELLTTESYTKAFDFVDKLNSGSPEGTDPRDFLYCVSTDYFNSTDESA